MALLVAKERSSRFSCTLGSPQRPLNNPGQFVQPDREIRLCNNVEKLEDPWVDLRIRLQDFHWVLRRAILIIRTALAQPRLR